jgi:hypothetical protein
MLTCAVLLATAVISVILYISYNLLEPSDMGSGLMSCCWHSLWLIVYSYVQSLKRINHLDTEIRQLTFSPLSALDHLTGCTKN